MKPPKLSMITEYMEMGSLYYLIHTTGQKSLSWRRRLKMLRDICRWELVHLFLLLLLLPAAAPGGYSLERSILIVLRLG